MIYVRESPSEPARAWDPRAAAAQAPDAPPLSSEGARSARASCPTLTAKSLVSTSPDGPFERLATAVITSGALRDTLGRAFVVPSLRTRRRDAWILLGLSWIPLAFVLELDRELFTVHFASTARWVLDVVIAVFVTIELTRATPRTTAIAAVALAAVTTRFALVIARPCGHGVHPGVVGSGVVALIATVGIATRLASRRRVAIELLDRLGISPVAAREATTATAPTLAELIASIAAGAALPLLTRAAGRHGVAIWVQAVGFTVYALAAPALVRRVLARRRPVDRPPPSPTTLLVATLAGLALTGALAFGSRAVFELAATVPRCFDAASLAGARLLEREGIETARATAAIRGSLGKTLVTVLLVPILEERIYRGLVQDALARRFGLAYGIFTSAVVFGVAHANAYEIAIYQTIAVGVALGVTYAEGGLLAAIAVHATYNLLLLAA